MTKKSIALAAALLFAVLTTVAQQRSVEKLDTGWKFHLGSASSLEKDFRNGTEYFNYLTKAHSIHNEGPYSQKFSDADWQEVRVPHDWAVALPFAPEASHSHGYKTVGWKYPETSVGWYRKTFHLTEADRGKHVELLFDGIFRDSRVWVNGFYCGGERSGYLSQCYDITDYLEYGKDNLICVRADASLEEGWFYEGAGIYRNAWLVKTSPLHIEQDGISVTTAFTGKDYVEASITVGVDVRNSSHNATPWRFEYRLLDAEGREVVSARQDAAQMLKPSCLGHGAMKSAVFKPHLWSPATPYLYKVIIDIYRNAELVDTKQLKYGIRAVEFDKDKGLILNGQPLKIKGVNMHQDHAGVGAAIPDGLQEYRVRKLKAMGCNAYRSSHNPMSPAMLDVCDSLGMLVIDENRLSGISEYEITALKKMIDRDRNHPSIILWSAGNEEWGIEWDERGERIAATMRDYCHQFDPTRPMTFATSSGPTVEVPVDVAGYNYIMQNPVEELRAKYPERKCLGSEETTGCGTRGVYYDDPEGRWMMSLNRKPNGADSIMNCIERGWKFYAERPWAAGLFYWTGFDYRGEPNPLSYPAVGSQFGILDYCGFPKDEAYYLKAWWTNENVLHIFPHWNLQGHEGEAVEVWAYSNCDEVELFVNGKSAGRKQMPKNGHLAWQTIYQPGKLLAVGYKNGRKVMQQVVETTGEAVKAVADVETCGDVTVVNVTLKDKKGRTVPTACNNVCLTIDGDGTILGAGNGDSAFKGVEQPATLTCKTFTMPAFNGNVQFIVRGKAGGCQLTVNNG